MIMFYSAAKKIGFQVPKKGMDDALRYVRRSFDKKQHGFVYALAGDERYCSRATVGAGIMCLFLGDDVSNPTIPEAADWIHRNSFEPYNGSRHPEDRYHYSAFYCSQAMALLGGKDFQEFYPKLLLNFSHHQHEDGSWEPEAVADGDIRKRLHNGARRAGPVSALREAGLARPRPVTARGPWVLSALADADLVHETDRGERDENCLGDELLDVVGATATGDDQCPLAMANREVAHLLLRLAIDKVHQVAQVAGALNKGRTLR